MKTYFIADLRLNHENIINYCDRPFENVKQMDEVLIDNWNSTVNKNDQIFVLGDFALATKEQIKAYADQLNGTKILILGNHDHYNEDVYRSCGFKYAYKYPIVLMNFMFCHMNLYHL